MAKCECKRLTPCKCRKVALRIECYTCGYPYCESMYPDKDIPMDCQASYEELRDHVKECNNKPYYKKLHKLIKDS